MDFERSEEQEAVAELAGRILGERCAPARLRALEREGTWFAADAWTELARADLLGVALPAEVGGGGYGFFEVCLLLEQQGRTVAPLPLLPTLVLGALPIARFGSESQQQRWLPGVVAGSTVLSGALGEPGEHGVAEVPSTAAQRHGEGWRIDGEKSFVPAADAAAAVLVPARTGAGSSTVFIVELPSSGVHLERNVLATGEPVFTVRLDGVDVEDGAVLGGVDQGEDVLGWIEPRAVVALCATAVGVCDGALALTAAYVSEREQFGAKIGTFQAVAQRMADAYIDTEAIRLTALQAAWRLSEDLDAGEAVPIAKFWAADGGHRVVHACQHLHGGIGVDLDYPVHRYFRWAKVLEVSLGSATEHLRRLGAMIATG